MEVLAVYVTFLYKKKENDMKKYNRIYFLNLDDETIDASNYIFQSTWRAFYLKESHKESSLRNEESYCNANDHLLIYLFSKFK